MRVMICGQKPFVTVVTLMTVMPLLVPATGQQLFVALGGSNVQMVPHSTVLFGAQTSANGPGETTL